MSDQVNVLLVDDEIVVLEAFVDILEDEGYKMFTADCGEKAMEVLRANPIDIVVSDINMPGMDGLQLLSLINEMDPEIPVIMATAYSSIDNTVECMRRGASNYLIKPIKVELLRSVLAEAAAKRRILHENRGLTDGLNKSNEALKSLNIERERVLELIAQKLRQPLIDQMNWCELLMTDSERSLHREHIETVAKVSSAAEEMLSQVQELLDGEKLQDRCQDLVDAEPPAEQVPAAACSQPVVPSVHPDRVDFKVLVVEDAPILRDVLVGVLQRKFHVLSAADGWQAMKLLVERPHLILTELDTPCVDTTEFLRHANKVVENISVIALYEAEDAARLAALSSLGVRDAIAKPFRVEEVMNKVAALAETTAPQMNESLLLVGPPSHEHNALHGLLASRYRTSTAASAESAMTEDASDFDLVIIDTTDQSHPWENDVTSVREKNEEIKVLALTDGKDAEIASAAERLEINSTVIKPYAFDDLLFRVRRLLDVEEMDGRVLRSVFRRPLL